MPIKVFILIETAAGETRAAADAMKRVGAIRSVDVVTGPFDIMAVIEAPDMQAMGRVLEQDIHTIAGVTRTVTCVAIASQPSTSAASP